MHMFLHWLVSTGAIIVVAYILPGITVDGLLPAFVAAVVLGLINTFIRPILILLTLPITFFSLGIFILVINALLVMFTGALVPGFEVANFWWALLFGVLLFLVHQLFRRHDSAVLKSFGHRRHTIGSIGKNQDRHTGRKRVRVEEVEEED